MIDEWKVNSAIYPPSILSREKCEIKRWKNGAPVEYLKKHLLS